MDCPIIDPEMCIRDRVDTERDRNPVGGVSKQELIATSKEVRRETTVLPLVEVRGEQVELVRKSNARYEKIKDLGKDVYKRQGLLRHRRGQVRQ